MPTFIRTWRKLEYNLINSRSTKHANTVLSGKISPRFPLCVHSLAPFPFATPTAPQGLIVMKICLTFFGPTDTNESDFQFCFDFIAKCSNHKS